MMSNGNVGGHFKVQGFAPPCFQVVIKTCQLRWMRMVSCGYLPAGVCLTGTNSQTTQSLILKRFTLETCVTNDEVGTFGRTIQR